MSYKVRSSSWMPRYTHRISTSYNEAEQIQVIQENQTGRLEVLYESRATLAYCGHHSLEDLLNITLCLGETFPTSHLV